MMMGVSDDIREVDGIEELLGSAVLECDEGNNRIRPSNIIPNAVIVQDNNPDAFFKEYDSAKQRHLQALLKKVNFDALRSKASGLRNNVPCYIPAAAALSECEQTVPDVILDQTGGQNCNLDICFEDGVVWMVRLRFEEPTVLPRDAGVATSCQ
jgi:hypothetical protein